MVESLITNKEFYIVYKMSGVSNLMWQNYKSQHATGRVKRVPYTSFYALQAQDWPGLLGLVVPEQIHFRNINFKLIKINKYIYVASFYGGENCDEFGTNC